MKAGENLDGLALGGAIPTGYILIYANFPYWDQLRKNLSTAQSLCIVLLVPYIAAGSFHDPEHGADGSGVRTWHTP